MVTTIYNHLQPWGPQVDTKHVALEITFWALKNWLTLFPSKKKHLIHPMGINKIHTHLELYTILGPTMASKNFHGS